MPYKIVVHQTCKKVSFNPVVLSFGTKGAKERTKENAAWSVSLVATSDKASAALTAPPFEKGGRKLFFRGAVRNLTTNDRLKSFLFGDLTQALHFFV